MTEAGEKRILNSAKRIVGEDALIVPSQIKQIYVSPRQRARRTLNLLNLPKDIPVEETELIREWDYGDYEGLTSRTIEERLKRPWNVFKDGCPNGDNQETVKARVDHLIEKIRRLHELAQKSEAKADVLIVAHGHILRSFAARWINDPVVTGTRLAYGAGGAVSPLGRIGMYWH